MENDLNFLLVNDQELVVLGVAVDSAVKALKSGNKPAFADKFDRKAFIRIGEEIYARLERIYERKP